MVSNMIRPLRILGQMIMVMVTQMFLLSFESFPTDCKISPQMESNRPTFLVGQHRNQAAGVRYSVIMGYSTNYMGGWVETQN